MLREIKNGPAMIVLGRAVILTRVNPFALLYRNLFSEEPFCFGLIDFTYSSPAFIVDVAVFIDVTHPAAAFFIDISVSIDPAEPAVAFGVYISAVEIDTSGSAAVFFIDVTVFVDPS